MTSVRVHPNIVEARLLPNLVRLSDNLIAASFSLMKIIPAKFMLDKAASEGRLEPGGKIIETSSGTFGLALAMLCALKNYHLTLVSDPAIDRALGLRIKDLGARLEIVEIPAEKGGLQQARMDRMQQLQQDDPEQFWPSQYHNPQNSGAYAAFVELLAESLGKIDCLIGTVGSGGSMAGSGRYLRSIFPDIHLIAVDTMNSVLFGQPDGKRLLRGCGNSLMPQNLDHTLFNEVHWVTAAEAFCATRILHRRHALYMGGTSGAAFLVADWWARENPGKTAVVIFPDEGHRYATSIYDDDALKKMNAWVDDVPDLPHQAEAPSSSLSQWSYLHWDRKPLLEWVGSRARES